MEITCTNDATSLFYDREIMGEFYDDPIEFAGSESVRVRREVGDGLIERYPAIEAVSVADSEDESDDRTDAQAADADDDEAEAIEPAAAEIDGDSEDEQASEESADDRTDT